MDNNVKLCECGCGQPAPIAKNDIKKYGYKAGQPKRFIQHHKNKVIKSNCIPDSAWLDLKDLYIKQELSTREIGKLKGCSWQCVADHLVAIGVTLRKPKELMAIRFKKNPPSHRARYENDGYVFIYCPEHPYADIHGYVREHRLIVEKRIGRYLLPSEQVHHCDGITNHNVDSNLLHVSAADHSIRSAICSKCELRKEIRLLQWTIKELSNTLQFKLGGE
jgi:hypothetical protein